MVTIFTKYCGTRNKRKIGGIIRAHMGWFFLTQKGIPRPIKDLYGRKGQLVKFPVFSRVHREIPSGLWGKSPPEVRLYGLPGLQFVHMDYMASRSYIRPKCIRVRILRLPELKLVRTVYLASFRTYPLAVSSSIWTPWAPGRI